MTTLEQYLSGLTSLAAGRTRKILTKKLRYRFHGTLARYEVAEMLAERGGVPYGEPTLETFAQWRARCHKNRDMISSHERNTQKRGPEGPRFFICP